MAESFLAVTLALQWLVLCPDLHEEPLERVCLVRRTLVEYMVLPFTARKSNPHLLHNKVAGLCDAPGFMTCSVRVYVLADLERLSALRSDQRLI